VATWFEKKELRRFRRIDMNLKLFVTPSDPINDLEIFALGIDYFPKTVSSKIAKNRSNLLSWIEHIQEQKEILEPVFHEVIGSAELLGESLKMLSEGRNPILDDQIAEKIHKNLKVIGSISSLEEHAPRTFNYFYEVERKLTHYFRLLLISLHKSSEKDFHGFSIKRTQFKIDEMTAKFTQEAFQKIPLIQSIYYMNQLVANYCEIFEEMNLDYYLRDNPNECSLERVNVSEGGLSLHDCKRYIPGLPLQAYIHMPNHSRVMQVKTILARSESNFRVGQELNAFYFEFPDPQDQKVLELEIVQAQIDRAMEVFTACDIKLGSRQ